MTLRPDQLDEYRALLGEVNRMAQADLVALWRSLEGVDKDALFASLRAGVPEIVALYRQVAADTATLFYSETQGIAFSASESLAAARVNNDQVNASLRWALFGTSTANPLGLISGIVQKHVINGSRQYALDGFGKSGGGWWRAARPEACAFCRMLATRAVTEWGKYGSADAAATVGMGKTSSPTVMVKGDSFHEHCMCIPVKADEYEIPSYVEQWTAHYKAAVGQTRGYNPTQVLSVMRELGGISH